MQRTIEKNDWISFFETFTMQHDHWLVSVDGEKETLPLEGITITDGTLVVRMGGDIRHHRRITIDAAAVRVHQTNGVDTGVDIEASDGHTTKLRFRNA